MSVAYGINDTYVAPVNGTASFSANSYIMVGAINTGNNSDSFTISLADTESNTGGGGSGSEAVTTTAGLLSLLTILSFSFLY